MFVKFELKKWTIFSEWKGNYILPSSVSENNQFIIYDQKLFISTTCSQDTHTDNSTVFCILGYVTFISKRYKTS